MPPIPQRPPKLVSDLLRGTGVAAIGDSITIADGDNATNNFGARSWFTRACMASGQQLRFVRNAGISGNTTTQMLARLTTDVIAHRPDRCFVLGGINDIGAGTALSTVRSNLQAIYRQLRGAGVEPIPCTLTPSSNAGRNQSIQKLNAWIRWYAMTNGYTLVDLAAATTNTTTGEWLAGYSDDGTHPTTTATKAMAERVLTDVLGSVPNPTPYLDRYPATSAAAANLLQRGLFDSDANADGLSDSWTLVNSSGVTVSRATATGVYGYEQILECTDGLNHYITQNAFAGSWAVGDRLAFVGRLTTINGTTVTGTATSGGASTLTDSGKSWATNQWANAVVRITAGTGSGQYRDVASNTATQITTQVAWTTQPDNTSQYELIGGPLVHVKLVFTGASGQDVLPVYNFNQAVSGYVWYAEAVVPAGTTAVAPQIVIASGVGTIKVSQVTLVNMTALGMI